MSKLSILSQADQCITIDVSGCDNYQEAYDQLSSILKVSSQFWRGFEVQLNLGNLELTKNEILKLKGFFIEVGLEPNSIIALNQRTKLALEASRINPTIAIEDDIIEIDSDESVLMSYENYQADIINTPDLNDVNQTFQQNNFKPTQVSVENIAHNYPSQKSFEDEQRYSSQSNSIKHPNRHKHKTETMASTLSPGELPQIQISQQPSRTNPKPDNHFNTQVLYLKQTLRAGQVISHKGNLVIIGDINPGAEVIAQGDITIWGALKGIAHAGVGGNLQAEIRALKLDPIQIRIANLIARSPDKAVESNNTNVMDKIFAKNNHPHNNTILKQKSTNLAEIAKVVDGKIKISKTNLD